MDSKIDASLTNEGDKVGKGFSLEDACKTGGIKLLVQEVTGEGGLSGHRNGEFEEGENDGPGS